MKTINVGSDFSGVGAFDQALIRLGIKYNTVFACDMDKHARQTYIHNYGEPDYFPMDVYDREIPTDPLDIYMTSPPCQAFSLAGKRRGEDDKRGILFYNSHEFIQKNNPRFFIFENVKGLLSDDSGKTFRRWVEYLGGKSINGNPVLFPHPESVPYHIYYRVLNAKDYGIPQNRERVFIIGIRDDVDNNFTWPKEVFLEKRLKDVLEDDVDEKYYLSEKMLNGFISHAERQKEKGNGFTFEPTNGNGVAKTITTGEGTGGYTNFIKDDINILGEVTPNSQAGKVYSNKGLFPTITAGTHGYANGYVSVKSATSKGYEVAEIGEDSINFEQPNSKTRRGRVGEKVAQTLTTSCNQGVAIGAIRGRNPDNPTSRISGHPTQQMLEINQNGTSNALTTVQKDNVVVLFNLPGKHEQNSRVYGTNGLSPTLTTMQGGGQEPKVDTGFRIRKLTPRECFRLMDFPDSFTWPVSDTQAYKQAGNSICVGVLAGIINKLNI